MSGTRTAEKVKNDALRAEAEMLLAQCTDKQAAFFMKIHADSPWGSWENCPDKQVAASYALLCRTVNSNRALATGES